MKPDHTGAGESLTRPRHLFLHFAGAAVTKLAPPLVQLVLLLLVARDSTLDDVGRLALASAVSFLCGALAELGFATTLSIPRPTFGTAATPLRATGRVRVVSALAGGLLYVVLWGAGLGSHGAVFLLVAPLPFLLALSYGYAGAMNASGRLRIEGAASVAESVAIVVIAVVGSLAGSALTWSLVALTVGRAGGTLARAILVRDLPQSTEAAAEPVFGAQLPFALFAVVIVVRFAALVLNVEILRAGRQRDEIPVLAVASVVLAVGAVVAALTASVSCLAGARLASEAITAAGYLVLARRLPRGQAVPAAGKEPGRRLRLLVLTPFPPSLDGAHGGSRVISQFLARMAERYDVALVCLRHPRDPPVDPVLRSRLALVEEVDRPDWSATRLRRFAGGLRTRLRLFAGTPLWACEVDVGAYRERLRAVLAEWRPDIAQIEYTVMGTYIRELGAAGVLIVLVESDT